MNIRRERGEKRTKEVKDTAGVAPLVVVPGDELDEVLVERDTGLGIEDGGVRVAVQVAGDNFVLGVSKDAFVILVFLVLLEEGSAPLTLQLALSGSLDGLLDLVVGGTLLDTAGQVDDGDVGGWNTHGHAGKLAVQVWDDLADSLGGTGGRRDDILRRGAATTPVLGRWAVDSLLSRSVRVDRGHETLDDGVLVVDDLGQRSQAVGRARGVGDDLDGRVVRLVVDAHDEHGGVGGWRGDDDLLGAALQVALGLVGGSEDTGRLDDVVGLGLTPWDGGWVTLLVEANLLAVDGQVVAADRDLALEAAVCGVILQHVDLVCNMSMPGALFLELLELWTCTYSVCWIDEGIVDGDDVDVIVLNAAIHTLVLHNIWKLHLDSRIAEDDSANTTEAVDADLNAIS